MQAKVTALLVGTAASAIAVAMFLQNTRAQQNQDTPGAASVAERGQYLVHHVAMCIYCHTPRNERGVPDERRLLHGAPMPVESPFPAQKWAFMAPKIAGLPGGWTDVDMVRFLQTGESPTGRQPQPPMPPFRLNEDDARAVAAYLKSLP